MKIKEASNLVIDIEKLIENWNERSSFKLAGEKNLSRADLDTLLIYCQSIFDKGSIYGLMKPLGSIANILRAYKIID